MDVLISSQYTQETQQGYTTMVEAPGRQGEINDRYSVLLLLEKCSKIDKPRCQTRIFTWFPNRDMIT